jgi:DNA-binding transcriptional regulator YiaG
LAELCRRLKESDSWEFKRRIVEILVAEVRVDLVEEDGERRAVATVTYRFGETNTAESAPSLSEMHEHIVESRRAAPDSLGHHIRKRRLSLKLRQKDVAPQFGVDTTTVHNWETGTRAPRLESVPKIIAFLGYNPLPAAATTPERLQVCRKVLGLSQKELAARLCVDPSTLAHWEQGRHAPAAIYTRRIDEFLSSCVW